MANETYGLGIRVETSSAERSLQVLQNQFARLQRIIATSTTASGKDLDRLTKMLNQTEASMKRLQAASNTAGTAAAKVGKDFTGVSRVIQDLPFGFTAISNNLTQLVPAAGAAGLAFSALVSAITFASTGTTYWTRGAEKAAKATKEFSDELNGAKASAISTGMQLQAFVNIAKDGNLPLSQRNEALKQANEILGEHGEKLTLANIATKDITKQVENFTQALIQQAVASKYSDKAAELFVKQAELAQQYKKDLDAYNKAQAAFVNRPVLSVRDQEMGRGTQYIIDRDNALKKLKQTTEDYKNTTAELKGTSANLEISTKAATSLMGTLGTKTDEDTKKTKAATEARKAFNMELYNTKMAGQAALDAMQDISITNTDPTKPATQGGGAQPLSYGQLMAQIEGKKNDEFFANMRQKLKENDEQLKQNAASAAAFKMQLAGVAVDGFEAMINAATAADASFESISKALLNMIKQLAVAAAKALIFKAIMGAVSGGTTVVGGAVGGGFLGKIFGFATGGIVTGPTPAMIGEGTEAEAVMPLSQLQNVIDMNSGGNGYIADTRISGADLLLMIRRATQSGAFSGTSFG